MPSSHVPTQPLSYCESETAEHFFADLQSAITGQDHRAIYSRLSRIFTRLLHFNTAETPVKLVGPFAQTDYLLKKKAAQSDLREAVNDARVRMRRHAEIGISEEELRLSLSQDLQALCRFVALLYDKAIPDTLQAQFPKIRTTRHRPLSVTDYMRVIVDRWDDRFLHARTDNEMTLVTVDYARGQEQSHGEGSYLQTLLREGTQLNLIRPTLVNDILVPEFIIYEPDYLVDVSAIAACFESYGISPYTHLLNKLKPAPRSEAILLGNLASQFLDEAIHPPSSKGGYAESLRSFFKSNAFSLLETNPTPAFHDNARQQRANIGKAVKSDLPHAVKDYSPDNIVLEPSFFCEMLGIQGRMDMLQLDHSLIVEQKSGKGGRPQTDPDTPCHQQKHYVQMLLYMAVLRYNFKTQHDLNHRSLYAFLLYSKYKNGLLGLGFAPRLLFGALRLRNEMTACEIGYTRNGLDILKTLTPDTLHLSHSTNDKLWEQYQKPQIENLLRPIREADPLERAYYLRMLTFLHMEHYLSKVGNQRKENSGFAAKWHETLDDKRQAGNIYERLSLLSPTADHEGKVERLLLGFDDDTDHEVSNFRTGDIVVLHPYSPGAEPDLRKTFVFRCTVEAIDTRTLTLALRAPQSSARIFARHRHDSWAVEHDFLDSSQNSLYRGMHSFLSAPSARRKLLLFRRPPKVDTARRLIGDYGRFNELALRVKQADELFLIIGPPGTGKTSFGLMNTLKEELYAPESSVLLMSYTNRAVDEICGKLVEEGLPFIRLGSSMSCAAPYRHHLMENLVRHCSHLDDIKALISDCRIFVGTTTAFNSRLTLFKLKSFSLAIVDEASQILEPHLVGLFSAQHSTRSAIRKFVLIGDHKQLPAVVAQTPRQSRVDDSELRSVLLTDCRLSLFERMLRKYRHDPSVVYMLRHQGRMHADIAEFPNTAFYGGLLDTVPLDHQLAPLPRLETSADALQRLVHSRRLLFLSVPSPDNPPSDNVNTAEAAVIASIVRAIHAFQGERFRTGQTIGVIVPYRNQISAIRSAIAAYDIPQLHDITIDTVERFQGSQRDYIIYGFTIQKHHQLHFLTDNTFEEDGQLIDRKLNVAMTRARHHLILIGNEQLLAHSPVFASLMDFARRSDSFKTVSPDHFVRGDFKTTDTSI